MKNKKISLILAIIMIMSNIILLFDLNSVFALEQHNELDEKIITKLELKKNKEFITLYVSFEENEDVKINPGDYFYVVFNFDRIKNIENINILSEEIILEYKYSEENITSIGKVIREDNNRLKAIFNDNVNNLEEVGGEFYLDISGVELEEESDEGNITVEIGKREEKLEIKKESNTDNGENYDTDNVLYKTGDLINNEIRWAITINAARNPYNNTNIYENGEYSFKITDKLEQTMKWNNDKNKKEYIIVRDNSSWRNRLHYELNQREIQESNGRLYIPIDIAKNKGISIETNDDTVEIQILAGDGYGHPLDETDISIVLWADIVDSNASEVTNYIDQIETTIPGFDNLNPKDLGETILLGSSGGIGYGKKIKPGQLFINKIESDTKKPIENVEFELVMREDNTRIVSGTTNEDGELTFSDLKPGNYRLIEVSAPSNIEFDKDDPYKLDIVIEKGKGKHIIVENKVKSDFENENEFKKITINKIWKDSRGNIIENYGEKNYHREEVNIQIYPKIENEQIYIDLEEHYTIKKEDNWSIEVEVPKYHNGLEIEYEFCELELDGFEVEIDIDIDEDNSVVSIINTEIEDQSIECPDKEEENPGTDPDKEEENPGTDIDKEEENPGTDPDKEEENPGTDPDKEEENPGTDPDKEEENPGTDPDKEEENPSTDPDKEEENPGTDPDKEEENPGTDPDKEEENPGTDPDKEEKPKEETKPKEPNKNESTSPEEPEDRPYERPGNPTKPKEETKPKEPNKNEPIKPEEPKEVEVEEIEEIEEPKESNIDSNKVESNKKEKEEEIKIVTEKPKENINVFDENKAPQTGDEFSLALNILVLMASILGLYTLSKKRK